jgi:hypothetical protein
VLRPSLLSTLAIASLSLGCTGKPTPTPIAGEPVCPDFVVGAVKTPMRGGLKQPVSITVLEDGEVIMRTTVVGLRTPADPPTRIVVPDADGEYTVEWGQCENERAPRPVSDAPARAKGSTAPVREGPAEYECGKSTVYKTDKLVTKKGDPASHALTFPPPPRTDCWTAEVPAATTAAAADAGAAPAVEDAGAEPAAVDGGADAGADAAPAAPTDAGASPTDAGDGAKKPDAGKKKSEKKDAGN